MLIRLSPACRIRPLKVLTKASRALQKTSVSAQKSKPLVLRHVAITMAARPERRHCPSP
jgi:hypothetical protein